MYRGHAARSLATCKAQHCILHCTMYYRRHSTQWSRHSVVTSKQQVHRPKVARNTAQLAFPTSISLFTLIEYCAVYYYDKLYRTTRVEVYLETHCNIGSKRAFPTGVLYRWHNCLLIYWRTTCLVSAFDDTKCHMPATEWCQRYVPCYLFLVSNSVCFSSIYLSLSHTSTAAYYWF